MIEKPSIAVSFWIDQPVRLGFSNTEIAIRKMAEEINAEVVMRNAANGVPIGVTGSIAVYAGSGAPTISAGKGSLYLRSDGSATNNRAYINTDGGTTWTAMTTAA